ncbi:ATP-dependent DNA helicase PIF1 [Dendrobium catenatum]|uniref:ATP-dependent DNA helicase n=1 Tax=Dendrobium catenatum TaxID=906689 RepID=A0A2I0XAF4_9ASPA|nr:ATP-dependent DNA helicase PIF1 [Dendrobium catenatum]
MIEDLNIFTAIEDINNIHCLNIEQKNAYDEIISHVNKKQNDMFSIDGSGGTGKIYLYRAILAKLRCNGHIALAMTISGVVTSILLGG